MKLSEHFSLDDLTVSQEAARRGLDNTPPDHLLPALVRTAEGLERVRAFLGNPVLVSSGYRNPTVNALVGGKPTSQHVRAEAADITCPGYGPPAELAAALAGAMDELGIDQVILEFGRWVHVSFADKPRHMALTIGTSGTMAGIHA